MRETQVLITMSEYNEYLALKEVKHDRKPYIMSSWGETWYANVDDFNQAMANQLQDETNRAEKYGTELYELKQKWYVRFFGKSR